MSNQSSFGVPQTIKICEIELMEYRTLEQAIENFKAWVKIGVPDRFENKLWGYVPTLQDEPWGSWDSVKCHQITLKLSLGNIEYRWDHLFPSTELVGVSRERAAQKFLDRLDLTNWELGFFDWKGDKD